MTWTVDILHYGQQRVPGAQVYHQAAWDTWHEFSFYIFLLKGDAGTVLIDCGMDDPAPLNEAIARNMGEENCIRHLPTGGTLAEVLASHNLTAEDIDYVGLTHLHADHAGNANLFPNATFILGRRGWEAHLKRRTTHPALVSAPAFPPATLDALDKASQTGRLLLGDDSEEVLPGIRAQTIGGHTDDSTAFVIDSVAGSVVIPGDTIWTFDNLEQNVPVGSHVSVPDCFDAMAWARTAGDILLPSHDPRLRELYPSGRVSGAEQ